MAESHPDNSEKTQMAARLIQNAKRLVIFTGAGMSAESGIATFRSSGNSFWGGLRGKFAMLYFGTPLGWKWTPRWGFKAYIEEFFTPIAQAKPNKGHIAIAELQKFRTANNLSTHIITMNVDGLHQEAGSPEESVSEVHGTVRRHRCVKNGHAMDLPEDLVIPPTGLPTNIPVPTCSVDGCGSTPRPDCVLFTESLPNAPFEKSYDEVRRLKEDDVMLVIGTSGVVYPAASLPEMAAKKCQVVEVNVDSHPSLDGVKLFIQGRVGEVLPNILEEIKK
eukprot:TRINITY_DN9730_c0_g1_i1.p1 TRINITY_DN9730_c0_g1~~TRINITY_DN9730_c0_g1_i1.p1  ORF type:complete len:277 (+),score=59.78 TRINITY_DN9730_c0_g1_i1:175-1005(+)